VSSLLVLPPTRWPGYIYPILVPTTGYMRELGKSWRTRTLEIVRELIGRDQPPS
jgi:hypothetical protein